MKVNYDNPELIKYIILLILGIICLIHSMYIMRDLNYDKLFSEKNFQDAEVCYSYMFKMHKDNVYRYNKAVALFNLNRMSEAQIELEFVVRHEKNNKEILDKSNKLLEIIRSRNIEKSELKRHDIGDYADVIKNKGNWQNHENIRVYIQNNDEYYDGVKRAFSNWDRKMYSMMNFSYVDNPQDADIVVTFVDNFSVNRPKKTLAFTSYPGAFYYKSQPDKIYFKQNKIELLKKHPITNQSFTDKQMYSIILHEIGHSVGIMDHSNQKGDLMYENNSSYAFEDADVSNRDVNTVKKIYGNI